MPTRHAVVLLPGGVVPAEQAYAALLAALEDSVDAAAKDLEVYGGEEPPASYSLDTEVDGVIREADARSFDRFHLVGYSAGGASALAFAARYGERLLSLALLEPALAGNARTQEEEALMQRFRALETLPRDEFMAAFVRLQLAPGVEPPPPPEGEPPAWMAKRPAGLRAIIETLDNGQLDLQALSAFDRPAYFATRGAQQPRLVCAHGEAVRRDLSGLHSGDVPRPPPLRSAAPDRGRAARRLAAGSLAAR